MKILGMVFFGLLLGIYVAFPLHAGEPEARVVLHSTVTGNREQPRVMYIVPWDEPGDSRMEYSLQHQIASELFAPLDRVEFLRALKYQNKINTLKKGEDHGKL